MGRQVVPARMGWRTTMRGQRGRKGHLNVYVDAVSEMEMQEGQVTAEIYRRKDSRASTQPAPVQGGRGQSALGLKAGAQFGEQLSLAVTMFFGGDEAELQSKW